MESEDIVSLDELKDISDNGKSKKKDHGIEEHDDTTIQSSVSHKKHKKSKKHHRKDKYQSMKSAENDLPEATQDSIEAESEPVFKAEDDRNMTKAENPVGDEEVYPSVREEDNEESAQTRKKKHKKKKKRKREKKTDEVVEKEINDSDSVQIAVALVDDLKTDSNENNLVVTSEVEKSADNVEPRKIDDSHCTEADSDENNKLTKELGKSSCPGDIEQRESDSTQRSDTDNIKHMPLQVVPSDLPEKGNGSSETTASDSKHLNGTDSNEPNKDIDEPPAHVAPEISPNGTEQHESVTKPTTDHTTDTTVQFLPYVWDSEAHSTNIVLLDNHPEVAQRKVAKQATDGIRGLYGFQDGCHTFKIDFNDKPWGSHCSVGICTAKAEMQVQGYAHVLGRDTESWAWDIPSRKVLHAGHVIAKQWEEEEEIPKHMTMVLDLKAGTLAIGLGGREPQVIFSDIPRGREKLYPAVTIVYGLTEVSIKLVESTDTESMKQSSEEPEEHPRTSLQVEQLDNPPSETECIKSQEDATSLSKDQEEESKMEEVLQQLEYTSDAQYAERFERYRTQSSRMTLDSGICAEDEDEEDIEDEYVELKSLSDGDRYLLEIAHGWDYFSRASGIWIHPNVPYICVPSVNFDDKVQAVRGRRGLQGGQHTWTLRELQTFSPHVQSQDMATLRNHLIIGVATSDHRLFNYGFAVSQLGRHVWGWYINENKIWQTNECNQIGDKEVSSIPPVDLRDGITVTLDTVQRSLTFVYKGKALPVTFNDLPKRKRFFPFLLYHKNGLFPVEMKYISGPKGHIDKVLKHIKGMDHIYMEDLVCPRLLHHQLSTRWDRVPLDASDQQRYSWGYCSQGFVLDHNSATCVSPPSGSNAHDMLVTSVPLQEGRHYVDIEIPHQAHCVLGAVDTTYISRGFSSQRQHTDTGSSVLGSGSDSWGWDVSLGALFHGGSLLGQFPPISSSVDLSEVNKYRMAVDFDPAGHHSLAFSALLPSGKEKELGVAFINLSSKVYITVAVVKAKQGDRVTISYQSGPAEFVNNLSSSLSAVCNIL